MAFRFGAPDRRRRARTTLFGEPPRAELLSRILGMYAEMPGLSVRVDQAALLFGVRQVTAERVLEALAAEEHLYCTDAGEYRLHRREDRRSTERPYAVSRLRSRC